MTQSIRKKIIQLLTSFKNTIRRHMKGGVEIFNDIRTKGLTSDQLIKLLGNLDQSTQDLLIQVYNQVYNTMIRPTLTESTGNDKKLPFARVLSVLPSTYPKNNTVLQSDSDEQQGNQEIDLPQFKLLLAKIALDSVEQEELLELDNYTRKRHNERKQLLKKINDAFGAKVLLENLDIEMLEDMFPSASAVQRAGNGLHNMIQNFMPLLHAAVQNKRARNAYEQKLFLNVKNATPSLDDLPAIDTSMHRAVVNFKKTLVKALHDSSKGDILDVAAHRRKLERDARRRQLTRQCTAHHTPDVIVNTVRPRYTPCEDPRQSLEKLHSIEAERAKTRLGYGVDIGAAQKAALKAATTIQNAVRKRVLDKKSPRERQRAKLERQRAKLVRQRWDGSTEGTWDTFGPGRVSFLDAPMSQGHAAAQDDINSLYDDLFASVGLSDGEADDELLSDVDTGVTQDLLSDSESVAELVADMDAQTLGPKGLLPTTDLKEAVTDFLSDTDSNGMGGAVNDLRWNPCLMGTAVKDLLSDTDSNGMGGAVADMLSSSDAESHGMGNALTDLLSDSD